MTWFFADAIDAFEARQTRAATPTAAVVATFAV